MTKITKAIIPVAGWGTRMLPITKAIEKCMLPVGTRPVIDYIVQDVVQAGIRELFFVVGEQSSQLQVIIVAIFSSMIIFEKKVKRNF
jgi:UTP--glucose-1-phosphate uridylyltransferase